MLINQGRFTSEETFFKSVRSEEFQALSQRLTDLGVERIAGLYDAVEFATGQNCISYNTPLANGFFLNLNSHSYGAQVEWDYVRFESGENAVTVEEVSFGGIKALYR